MRGSISLKIIVISFFFVVSNLVADIACAASDAEVLEQDSPQFFQTSVIERAIAELQVRSLKLLFKNEELTVDQYMDSLESVRKVNGKWQGTAVQ